MTSASVMGLPEPPEEAVEAGGAGIDRVDAEMVEATDGHTFMAGELVQARAAIEAFIEQVDVAYLAAVLAAKLGRGSRTTIYVDTERGGDVSYCNLTGERIELREERSVIRGPVFIMQGVEVRVVLGTADLEEVG